MRPHAAGGGQETPYVHLAAAGCGGGEAVAVDFGADTTEIGFPRPFSPARRRNIPAPRITRGVGVGCRPPHPAFLALTWHFRVPLAAVISLFTRFALGPGVLGAADGDEVANADISGTPAELEATESVG
jgi:hypothetical protein